VEILSTISLVNCAASGSRKVHEARAYNDLRVATDANNASVAANG